jgi:hypothetical protein
VRVLTQTIRSVALLVAFHASARADHHAMPSDDGGEPSPPRYGVFGASVSLVAASFSPAPPVMLYGGNYEGAVTSASWSIDRYSVAASAGFYRLIANGLETYGMGDLLVSGQATIVHARELHAGVVAAVSLATGDDIHGLGMGHAMAMPAAYVAWHRDRVALAATLGYSRALVHARDFENHDHGVWPLVEPMNMSEITWAASGEVVVWRRVRAGLRLLGGVPVGVIIGHDRVIGAARVAWASGRVDTTAELQVGFVGDPFTLRGVVSTALRF